MPAGRGAITVLNGVSSQTMPHVEQAEALARGRCRAIVRVPWDDRLSKHRTQRSASGAGCPGTVRPGAAQPGGSARLHRPGRRAGGLVATAPAPETRQRTRP